MLAAKGSGSTLFPLRQAAFGESCSAPALWGGRKPLLSGRPGSAALRKPSPWCYGLIWGVEAFMSLDSFVCRECSLMLRYLTHHSSAFGIT